MVKSYFNDGLDVGIKELYYKPRKRRFRKIRSPSLNFFFQADLFFFKNKVILNVIDIYSRRAYAELISNKKPDSVLKGFKSIVRKMEAIPKVLMIDGGNEFKGNFRKWCLDNQIEIRISEGNSLRIKQIKTKQGIIERYNRTLLNLLKSYMEVENKINFGQKDLDILNEDYNNHKHSSVGFTPMEIVGGEIPKKQKVDAPLKFDIGMSVRVLLQNPIIEKNSKTKRMWSKDVYYIISMDDNRFQLSNNEWYPYTRLIESKSKPTVWLEEMPSIPSRQIRSEKKIRTRPIRKREMQIKTRSSLRRSVRKRSVRV